MTEHTIVDGRFELLEALDDRGLGEVWAARDTRSKGRRVMVKFLRAVGAGTTRLQGELAQHLKALSALRHVCLLTVVHHGLWEGRPYLVHDAFEGHSLVAGLEKVRATAQPLAAPAIENLFDRLCAGLEVAHGARPPVVCGALDGSGVLIHRAPGRLFEVRVMDLGLVGFVDTPRRRGLAEELAIQCRAPECNGLPGTTVAADVFALGVLLRALLGEGERSDVPDAVRGVVEAATAREPGRRPASVRALRDALRSAWAGESAAPPRAAVVEPVAAAPAADEVDDATTYAAPKARAVVGMAARAEATGAATTDDVPDETEAVSGFGRGGREVGAGAMTVLRQAPALPVVPAGAAAPGVSFEADEVDDRTLQVANMPPGSNPWDLYADASEGAGGGESGRASGAGVPSAKFVGSRQEEERAKEQQAAGAGGVGRGTGHDTHEGETVAMSAAERRVVLGKADRSVGSTTSGTRKRATIALGVGVLCVLAAVVLAVLTR